MPKFVKAKSNYYSDRDLIDSLPGLEETFKCAITTQKQRTYIDFIKDAYQERSDENFELKKEIQYLNNRIKSMKQEYNNLYWKTRPKYSQNSGWKKDFKTH